MKYLTLLFAKLAFVVTMNAQNMDTSYYQIPDYPETYSAGNVAARVVDGLGFRFYWSTKGLSEKDLKFSPSEQARTTEETVDHIYNLALIVANSTERKPTVFPVISENLTFRQKRAEILANIRKASENLKQSSDLDLSSYKVVFEYENGTTREYPFWNQLNGPIADALWHCGQIVSFRRTSGNPLESGVSMLNGSKRD